MVDGCTRLFVYDTTDNSVRQLAEDFCFFGDHDWAPGEQRIASTATPDDEPDIDDRAQGTIAIVSVNGGNARLLPQLPNASPATDACEDYQLGVLYGRSDPSWSPDGNYIAYTRTQNFQGRSPGRLNFFPDVPSSIPYGSTSCLISLPNFPHPEFDPDIYEEFNAPHVFISSATGHGDERRLHRHARQQSSARLVTHRQRTGGSRG